MTGLLIFIGLILIILNVLAIKKQNRSFNGMLGNAMGNIQDDDIRIGELRLEFSESILEVQSEIMDIKKMLEKRNNLNLNYDSKQKDYNLGEKQEEESNSLYLEENQIRKENENFKEIIIEQPITINSNTKVEEIKRLFSEGLSTDEISKILHLGKGEVLLIKDLYIK